MENQTVSLIESNIFQSFKYKICHLAMQINPILYTKCINNILITFALEHIWPEQFRTNLQIKNSNINKSIDFRLWTAKTAQHRCIFKTHLRQETMDFDVSKCPNEKRAPIWHYIQATLCSQHFNVEIAWNWRVCHWHQKLFQLRQFDV